MGISTALNNALSGLSATSRTAQVISGNLANALTEGYATREVSLSARNTTGGVRVEGIQRHVDQALAADMMLSAGERAEAWTKADFLKGVERAIGLPGEAQSLPGRMAAFEASLVTAATRPEDDNRLSAAIARAGEVVGALDAASGAIQTARARADGEIAQAVEQVNTALEQLQRINRTVVSATTSGHVTAGLLDQGDQLLAQLSEVVPIRSVPRDNGAIAVFTTGGAILLDGTVARLEFTESNVVAPHMTGDNGLLSGLTINGVAVEPRGPNSPVGGGRLSALFELRDGVAVEAQRDLDAVARDLITRFEAPGPDPGLSPGDPGLFTDAGAAFDATGEVGLAGRIALNAQADPGQGGAAWRLRDGLGAAGPGPAGDSSLLQAMVNALADPESMASGGLGATQRDLSGHIGALVSRIGQERLSQDQSLTFANARHSELSDMAARNAVDSDDQMQRLLQVEQAYAANARLIETINTMMDRLLRI
ncbi:flagellar hook-associated protein FlgK [Roseovarius sp. MMSF_3281]|uniref:flagellar hook-associated protein FlgK n=1 Tax=Roseovarius sp. MMSF_3281 TaxID=3046694 RepID=UPI00273E3F4D|nr:flagellar hook-associated protein FlgK [Roseovarius sp. MMSF_3281]